MAIAWTTVIFLILLLPGFLFSTGLYFRQQFSRDTTPRNPLAYLAPIVLVSFVVHVSLFHLARLSSALGCPEVDLDLVLGALQASTAQPAKLVSLGSNISEHSLAITIYVILSAVLGFLIGYAAATAVLKGTFRSALEHSWVFELTGADRTYYVTMADVLTKVNENKLHLAYRGRLDYFSLQQDGQFSYLLLRHAKKFYLRLEETGAIASAARPVLEDPNAAGQTVRESESSQFEFLYIPGEEVANVVLHRYAIEPLDPKAVQEAIEAKRKASLPSDSPTAP